VKIAQYQRSIGRMVSREGQPEALETLTYSGCGEKTAVYSRQWVGMRGEKC
jgi:hypothetical protein